MEEVLGLPGQENRRVRDDDGRENHEDQKREEEQRDHLRHERGAERGEALDELEALVGDEEPDPDHVPQAEDDDERLGQGVPLHVMGLVAEKREAHAKDGAKGGHDRLAAIFSWIASTGSPSSGKELR